MPINWSTATDWDNATSEDPTVVHDGSVPNQLDNELRLGHKITNNVISYWPLTGTGSNAVDVVGGDDATINGATQGQNGILGNNAYSFDGVDDYLEASDLAKYSFIEPGDNPHTVEGWLYADQEGDYKTIYKIPEWGHHPQTQTSGSNGLASRFDTFGDNTLTKASDSDYTVGKWHHFIFTIDPGNRIECYIDGSKIYSDDVTDTSSDDTNQLIIGAASNDGRNEFDGRLAHHRIYNKGLTDTEAKNRYPDSGSLTTATKSFNTSVKPSLKNLQYSLNGQNITVDIIGSPDTASEEVQSVTLDGSNEYSLSWSSSHTDFRIQVNMSTSDVTKTPTFQSIDLESSTTTEVNLDSVTNVDKISADFTGSFNSDKSFSNLDLGFKIYDSSDNLVETLNTENIDTSNVTLPYTYSDSTDVLQDGTTYNVEAFATDLSTSTTYTSGQTSFTTDAYRTPDASGSWVQVTTAPDCNVTDFKGSGIASNPYIIQNAQQLYCIRQQPDAVYKINNKIDASYVNYDPISYFSGRIIGNDETIYNLETSLIETNVGRIEGLNVANSSYKDGLVKTNQGGTINDTAVRNVTVTGTDRVGGIAGESSGNIERCLVVDSTIDASGNAVGGLVGRSVLRTPNCYVQNTTVTGDQKVGGLSGIIVNDSIFDVHTGDTAVTGNAELGAVVGDYNGNDAFDAYFDSDVGYKLDDNATGLTTSEMTGDTAPNNMDLDFSDIWGVVIDPSDDYPDLETNDIPPAEPDTINNPDDTTDYDDPDDTASYTDFTVRTRFKIKSSDNFVNNFEDMIFNALTTGNSKNIETVKVGSDGSDTTASMNDVQTVIQSGNLDKDVSGRQIDFYAVFLAENLSSDVEEIGFFDQSGDLIYRIVFDTPKSASDRQAFETTYTIE